MRAAVVRNGKIEVEDIPVPQPGPGQVLVKTRACGICGSDLHLFKHGPEMKAAAEKLGAPMTDDITDGLVLGHEFVAEIVEFGPDTTKTLNVGDRVCSVPFILEGEAPVPIGASTRTTGAYAEYLLLQEMMLLPVAEELSDDAAALTEPVAVAIHAVNGGRVTDNDAAVVVGCGPIGLAIINVLRMRGVQHVIAADFSPTRRELASQMGATEVVDPQEISAFTKLSDVAAGVPAVVFECTGVNGVLSQVVTETPHASRIVVAGISAGEDSFIPMLAISKELTMQFVNYYTPEEYAEALQVITDGKINWQPLVTGEINLEGVSEAFVALGDPEQHAKILIKPDLN